MDERPEFEALRRFLTAEAASDDVGSEGALPVLLRSLPDERPARGFAARVLSRTRGARRWNTPWVRWTLAAAAAGVAVAVGLVPAFAGAVASIVGPAAPLRFAIAAFTAIVHRLAAGIEIWGTLAAAGRAIAAVLASPRLALLITTQLALVGVLLRGLAVLLNPRRSARHEAIRI